MNGDLETFKFAKSYLSIAWVVFLILSLRWFRLAPLIFENILHLAIFILYGIILFIFRKTNKNSVFTKIILIPTILLFLLNGYFLLTHLPSLDNTITCKNSKYYISSFHPFGDAQWTESRLTRWDGFFKYETSFFGYYTGKFELVCDEINSGINILTVFPNSKVFYYSYGEISREYLHIIAKSNHHIYTISEGCLIWGDSFCEVYNYTLIECKLDYTSCTELPIQYASDYEIYGSIMYHDKIGSVSFYEDTEPDSPLIFTYGENPHCYVKGCEILEP